MPFFGNVWVFVTGSVGGEVGPAEVASGLGGDVAGPGDHNVCFWGDTEDVGDNARSGLDGFSHEPVVAGGGHRVEVGVSPGEGDGAFGVLRGFPQFGEPAAGVVGAGAGGAGFGFVVGAPGVAESAFLGYGAGPVVGDGVPAGHAFDDADELRVDGEAGCGG